LSFRSVRIDSVTGDSDGVTHGDSNVSGFTPSGSPGVLDEPVGVGETNNEDSVVEGSARSGENTASVSVEVGVNADSDGDGVLEDGSLQLVDTLDGVGSLDQQGILHVGVGDAGSSDAFVRVRAVDLDLLVSDVAVGLGHPSSVASVASVR